MRKTEGAKETTRVQVPQLLSSYKLPSQLPENTLSREMTAPGAVTKVLNEASFARCT